MIYCLILIIFYFCFTLFVMNKCRLSTSKRALLEDKLSREYNVIKKVIKKTNRKGFFVDAVTGNDLNTGTKKKPLATIRKAVELAQLSDNKCEMIFVRPRGRDGKEIRI